MEKKLKVSSNTNDRFMVKVIDSDHPAYGMTGEVFYSERIETTNRTIYTVVIKGYDNCKKIGYTDEFIKKTNLDEIGFCCHLTDEKFKKIE